MDTMRALSTPPSLVTRPRCIRGLFYNSKENQPQAVQLTTYALVRDKIGITVMRPT